MSKKILIVACLFLASCKTVEIEKQPIPVEVKIPVAAKIEPAKIERTQLPISQLTPDSTDEEVAKAYVQSVEILLNEIDMYIEALSPYKENE